MSATPRHAASKCRVPFFTSLLALLVTGSFHHASAQDAEPAMTVKTNRINALSPAEVAAGWTLLFDGKTTDQWRGYKKDSFPDKGWSIDQGCIKVHAGGGGGDIITVDQYEDFELSLEWKVAEGANSGIMYRVKEDSDYPWQTGPEYQVLDDAGYGYDPISVHSAGALYDLYLPDQKKISRPVGEFNQSRIRIRHGVVQHFLNGVKVVEVDLNGEEWKAKVKASKFSGYEGFGVNAKGHLCLQDHGNDVWFRNIKVRDLNASAPDEVMLLTPGSMNGWTTFFRNGETSDDTFTFDGDVLKCKGQPIGYIRTTDTFTNFVLKLEWRFDPEKGAGNSGVLVRMIGEDTVWPRSVEAQLHSGNAGDFWNIGEYPMSTVESRTRGRNTKKAAEGAEHPIGEWNEYEIIVNGGDVVLFVNGEKLNHAWDVQENAGYICLQSEGAEIHFRNVRLAPIK